jgi:hypothetical protein
MRTRRKRMHRFSLHLLTRVGSHCLSRSLVQDKLERTSNKNFPHLLLMLNDRPAKLALQSTKRAIITTVQASKQVITCHCLQLHHSTHLSPFFFALAYSCLQRQSSRHGPERAVALTVGPVFRLPSSIEHGAQPVESSRSA